MNTLELIYDFINVPYLPSHSPTHFSESFLGSGWRATSAQNEECDVIEPVPATGAPSQGLDSFEDFKILSLSALGVVGY